MGRRKLAVVQTYKSKRFIGESGNQDLENKLGKDAMQLFLLYFMNKYFIARVIKEQLKKSEKIHLNQGPEHYSGISKHQSRTHITTSYTRIRLKIIKQISMPPPPNGE